MKKLIEEARVNPLSRQPLTWRLITGQVKYAPAAAIKFHF